MRVGGSECIFGDAIAFHLNAYPAKIQRISFAVLLLKAVLLQC